MIGRTIEVKSSDSQEEEPKEPPQREAKEAQEPGKIRIETVEA